MRTRAVALVAVGSLVGFTGCSDDDDDDAVVGPVASFTYAVDLDTTGSTVCTVQSVAFTDTSTGEPTTWSWEWSDGQTSNEADPTWEPTDASPTQLDAVLMVENDGGTSTATETIFFPVC